MSYLILQRAVLRGVEVLVYDSNCKDGSRHRLLWIFCQGKTTLCRNERPMRLDMFDSYVFEESHVRRDTV